MKKILLSLTAIFISLVASAQVTVYEYKNEKSYCTFELDTELAADSVAIKGTYRAYQFYDIPYFEMTFVARSYVLETGETVIAITPDFYYHSYLSKLIGQRDPMNPKYYRLSFAWLDDTISDITPEEEKEKVLNKSIYSNKGILDFTDFPSTFTKAKNIDWKKYPKDLRKNLQDKDKTLGRKY